MKKTVTLLRNCVIPALALLSYPLLFAQALPQTFVRAPYQVCFTPGGECTDLIIAQIDNAQKEILLQAYSFTSAPIAKAITNAKKRGLDVKAILDKGQFSAKYSAATFLLNQGVPVWNDDSVAIAHNKVIVIDRETVITGSFNFTKAAQEKNAENVIIISDKNLATQYIKNWEEREKVSVKMK